MLHATDLSYRTLKGVPLVDGVCASVASGEVKAVLGPNGAGKTTLLRMLSGELKPSSGSVQIGRDSVGTLPPLDRAKRLAVLPQSGSLAFPYPVLDVVLMGRMPHRKSSSHRLDRTVAWSSLKTMEAGHLAERIYTTLSGGEKQRVQMARILAQLEAGDDMSGRVLLLDEPTSALDLAHQHQLLQAARALASRGAAVLAILHDLNLAAQYADRLMILHSAKLVAEGVPSEVLKPCMIDQVYGVSAEVHHHPTSKCPFITTQGRGDAQPMR